VKRLSPEAASQKQNGFCAALFFSILRAEGGNPIIRKGALCLTFRRTPTTIGAGEWAASHDPNGAARLEYAKSIWAARDPNTEVVELG